DVYIVGVGMTALGRMADKSVKQLTNEAVAAALADAGCSPERIDAAWFANTRQPIMEGQNTVRGEIALHAAGLQGLPIINVENACASGSTGLNQAFAAIASGQAEITLVVGAEKM